MSAEGGPHPRYFERRPVCDGCNVVMPDPLSPARCAACARKKRRPTSSADRDATIGTRGILHSCLGCSNLLPDGIEWCGGCQCAAPHPSSAGVVCTKAPGHALDHVSVGTTSHHVWGHHA